MTNSKNLKKSVLFCALFAVITCARVGSAQALEVSQGYSTPYYAEYVAGAHTRQVFNFLDDELRKYDCLQGETDAVITKKAKTRIFSADTPGELFLSYKTRCHSPGLTKVRFHVSSIGYDEDYTQVALEVKTRGAGIVYTEICVYGLDGRLVDCPREYEKVTDFSKSIE